jgi:hypothetical protein
MPVLTGKQGEKNEKNCCFGFDSSTGAVNGRMRQRAGFRRWNVRQGFERGIPSFVNDAYMNASEDVLIGIGTYKVGNDTSKLGAGKTFAETRARADISRQLTTIVKNILCEIKNEIYGIGGIRAAEKGYFKKIRNNVKYILMEDENGNSVL